MFCQNRLMPYEVKFTKRVEVDDPEEYINDCCWGGDVVSQRLLPAIKKSYRDVQADQEDWGWFIWFRHGDLRLAVDIFCDDPETGEFRAHLSARRERFLRSDLEDRIELDRLRDLVVSQLAEWVGTAPEVDYFKA